MKCKLVQRCTNGTLLTKYLWLGFILFGLASLTLFNNRSNAMMRTQYFGYPERMVIYRNGSLEQLNATNPRYSKIYQQLQQRMHEPLYVAKLAAVPQILEQIKKTETAIEFEYSKSQSTTYLIHKTTQKYVYTRIVFPLTGTYSELFFLGDKTGYYSGPLGQLTKPENLNEFF
ncbi:MAG TPA: hypothetical protein VEC37_05775 [Bacillota bacterium]|nr:hypothetical protein [Bacillota bacterium]